jgi:hypothetical protein
MHWGFPWSKDKLVRSSARACFAWTSDSGSSQAGSNVCIKDYNEHDANMTWSSYEACKTEAKVHIIYI